MHTEIPIKVNAWVDEGVASLVTALNEIDGILTLDSCEHGPMGQAYVFFTYGQDWKELAALIQEISNLLSAVVRYGYSIRLEWLGTNVTPRAQVLVDPEHAALLADAITQSSPELNRRMRRSVGDRRRKAPHRLKGCSGRL